MMAKAERTLQKDMHDWLFYSPTNIVWQDSYFYEQMVKEYGKDVVEQERRRQERSRTR